MSESASIIRLFLLGVALFTITFRVGTVDAAQSTNTTHRSNTRQSTNIARKVSVVLHSSTKNEYPKLSTRLLYYIPDRILDFLDIFRLQAKLGPGLSFNAQATEPLSVYAGRENVVWVGLPGRRSPRKFRKPFGRKTERGLRLFGVDATDDTNHEMFYSPTEISLGANLLAVGAEVGFDILEMGDFFAGFLLFDIRGDDLERRHHFVPAPSPNLGWKLFDDTKPEEFETFTARLDYLREHLPNVLNTKTHELDYTLSGLNAYDYGDEQAESKMRLGLFGEFEHNGGFSLKPDVNLSIDASLPGLKKRWKLIISQKEVNELPGTLPSERENSLNVGLSTLHNHGIRTGLGVKARLPPELYGYIKWNKTYNPHEWHITPQIKGYYKKSDKIGQITSMRINRWLNASHSAIFRSSTAGRLAMESNGWELEQTFAVGYIRKLITDKHGINVRTDDVAYGVGLSASAFGHVNAGQTFSDRYRMRLVYRRNLYMDWVFLEVAPQCEWRREDDWTPDYTLRIGFDMLFYSIDN